MPYGHVRVHLARDGGRRTATTTLGNYAGRSFGGASSVSSTRPGIPGDAGGARLPVGPRDTSLRASDTDTYDGEHGAPQSGPIPAQPSAAIATGATTAARRIKQVTIDRAGIAPIITGTDQRRNLIRRSFTNPEAPERGLCASVLPVTTAGRPKRRARRAGPLPSRAWNAAPAEAALSVALRAIRIRLSVAPSCPE